MTKLKALAKLRGIREKDILPVQKEKERYLGNRLARIFLKKIKPTSLGLELEKDVVVDTGYGLFHCRKKSMDLHIVSGSYESKVVKLFEKLAKENILIVDVGANIGKYSILSRITNHYANVFAIEPETKNYDILVKNIKLNNLDFIHTKKIALGSKKGKLKLYISSKNVGGHSLNYKLVAATPEKDYNSFEEVEVNTLDNLFKDVEIDILKIDTEGFELEVLKGAKKLLTNKRIKNIIIELNDNETRELLESYGYSLELIQYSNYHGTLKDGK